MKIRLILSLLITMFCFQLVNAQQAEVKTSLDIVRLVTDTNFKLNTFYKQRVSGHEQEQASLQKAIYAANKELLEIRQLLTGGNQVNSDKIASLQKQVTSLQSAIDELDDSLSNAELTKYVTNIQSKAATLKKTVKKIKK